MSPAWSVWEPSPDPPDGAPLGGSPGSRHRNYITPPDTPRKDARGGRARPNKLEASLKPSASQSGLSHLHHIAWCAH